MTVPVSTRARSKMEDGLLSLKWNNHRSTFFHILSEVRGKHTYTDATLACEGKFFPVHKLVMSTCSDYFAEIFEKTPCKNPVVVLKDIKKSDLEALLDYMYIGEVDVRQSELAGLIKAAECLRIKGLAVPDEDPTKAQKKGPISVPERREDSPPAKRKRRESGGDRGRAPSPPISRGSSQSSSSHLPSTSSVPSQAPPQLSNVPESHVPSQSMPPPPNVSQETRHLDSGRGRQDTHSQSTQQHPSQISSLRPSPDPSSLRSPPSSGPESSHPPTASPRSSDPSILPVQMIKVEVDDTADNSGTKDSHGERDEGSEMDGDEEETSNDFSEYQSHGGEIEKEEHDQMDSYNADQIPGPSGLQGGPPVLGWGEEGEAGFPHNLFGGDDPAAQQALQGPDLARRAWESLSESLAARLASSAPPSRPPHRLGGSQLHSGGSTVTSDRPHMCPLCPYRATTRDSLARHIRTHTGERPFKCSYCPYRAIQKSDVDKHIRRRHKDAVSNWLGVTPACITNILSNVSNLTYTQPTTTAWQGTHTCQSGGSTVLTDSSPPYTSPPNNDT
ncbi:uncharacterized protein [Panulirus ornatus]|uniref:uncharacterized protein isoform X4 n=1 Tax=Panulirus ornatus TaxID=150431 RepID=UPI003A85F495